MVLVLGSTKYPAEKGQLGFAGLVLFGSQFGMSHGLRHFVPTGTFEPDGLNASAVALAETLAVLTPKIFMKKVGIALPRTADRWAVTVMQGSFAPPEAPAQGNEKVTSAAWILGA